MSTSTALPYSNLMALENLEVRPAASRDELEQAFKRVYWSYRYRSYIEESTSQMHLTYFNAFPGTVTFVSLLRNKVIASATLVEDTDIGLPMDKIYHKEVQRLRDAGRKLVEVTMFADRRNRDFRRSVPMLLYLMKHLFDYCCKVAKANDVCITVNPRHRPFYRRYWTFETIGKQKAYPMVQNNPAIAMRLDLDEVEDRWQDNDRLHRMWLENRVPISRLQKNLTLDCSDLRYFFIEETDTFQRAPDEAIACLQRHYPRCPWHKWNLA